MDFSTYTQIARTNLNPENLSLILFDEVHELKQPLLAQLSQLTLLKIGLTASPNFKSNLAEIVFNTIGPIFPLASLDFKAQKPANIIYTEIAVDLHPNLQTDYFCASGERERFNIASQNYKKNSYVQTLVNHHSKQKIIIIG